MTVFVTLLARKWCHEGEKTRMISDVVCREKIAAAIREALEEAEKVANTCQMPGSPDMSPLTHAGIKLARREIVAAIRALREG